MISNKLLITTVIMSLVGHMILIALSSMLFSGNDATPQRAFSVNFAEQSQTLGLPQTPPLETLTEDAFEAVVRKTEDTVELGDATTRYYSYLKHLKRKIEQHWTYPPDAYYQKEDGAAVVQFSITDGGDIIDLIIIASSGHDSLDEAALHAIRSVHRYSPIPVGFNLARLNVVAKFYYTLAQ
jgi:TonB family protein